LATDFGQQLSALRARVEGAQGQVLSTDELEAVADLIAAIRALLGDDYSV
jgi:hypothetical protein